MKKEDCSAAAEGSQTHESFWTRATLSNLPRTKLYQDQSERHKYNQPRKESPSICQVQTEPCMMNSSMTHSTNSDQAAVGSTPTETESWTETEPELFGNLSRSTNCETERSDYFVFRSVPKMARRYPIPNPLKLSGFELGSRELEFLSNQTTSIDSEILDDCSSGESDGFYGQTN